MCKISESQLSSAMGSKQNLITGSIFVAFGIVSFLVFFYAAIISKFLPPYQNPILAAIQNDRCVKSKNS